jgi:hypothetical protein
VCLGSTRSRHPSVDGDCVLRLSTSAASISSMALKHTVRPYGSGSRPTATGEPDRLRIDSDMRLSRVRQLPRGREAAAGQPPDATEVLVGPPLRLTPKGSRRIEKPISTSRALAPSRLNKTEPRPTKFRPHFASLSIICLASFGPMPLSSCLK